MKPLRIRGFFRQENVCEWFIEQSPRQQLITTREWVWNTTINDHSAQAVPLQINLPWVYYQIKTTVVNVTAHASISSIHVSSKRIKDKNDRLCFMPITNLLDAHKPCMGSVYSRWSGDTAPYTHEQMVLEALVTFWHAGFNGDCIASQMRKNAVYCQWLSQVPQTKELDRYNRSFNVSKIWSSLKRTDVEKIDWTPDNNYLEHIEPFTHLIDEEFIVP